MVSRNHLAASSRGKMDIWEKTYLESEEKRTALGIDESLSSSCEEYISLLQRILDSTGLLVAAGLEDKEISAFEVWFFSSLENIAKRHGTQAEEAALWFFKLPFPTRERLEELISAYASIEAWAADPEKESANYLVASGVIRLAPNGMIMMYDPISHLWESEGVIGAIERIIVIERILLDALATGELRPAEGHSAINYKARAEISFRRRRGKNVKDLCEGILRGSSFDPCRMDFPIGNFIIDLRAHTIRQMAPDDLITSKSPIDIKSLFFDSAHKLALGLSVLLQIFAADDLETMVHILGATLIGENFSEKFCYLYGGGRNGKGLIADVLGAILGPDMCNARESHENIWGSRKAESDQRGFNLSGLERPRVLITEEPDFSVQVSANRVKKLTGGGEITASLLFKDRYSFKPRFFPIALANDPLQMDTSDRVAWGRVIMVKCPFSWDSDPALKPFFDPSYKSSLMKNTPALQGIFLIALAGAYQLIEAGFVIPISKNSSDGKERIIRERNPMLNFIEDCVSLGEGEFLPKATISLAYKKWASEQLAPQYFSSFFERFIAEAEKCFGIKLEESRPWDRGRKRGYAGLFIDGKHLP